MANSKISALTAATTPLVGTSVLPIVQGGVTKQVSVANLTVGRAVDTAGGTFTDNQTQGTAAKGINFTANTPAAGMTSELLNWYEEGTWTPSYASWTISPTTAFAKYTRVGRLVTLNFTAENGVSVAGVSSIGGLPFTSNGQQGASVLMKDISGASPGVYAFGGIGSNTSSIGAMTSATFTGLYWSFSTTYMV